MVVADASNYSRPKLYFKHLYGANPHEWGVIAFPTSQPPTKALKGYGRRDLVFLAVTKNPKGYAARWAHLSGKIFGVCTLYNCDVKTERIANPEMLRDYPDVAQRWPNGTPVNNYWNLDEPVEYTPLIDDEFLNALKARRGQMILVDAYPETAVRLRRLYSETVWTELSVYRSKETQEYISRLAQV